MERILAQQHCFGPLLYDLQTHFERMVDVRDPLVRNLLASCLGSPHTRGKQGRVVLVLVLVLVLVMVMVPAG